jgi:hypothetical protein
MKQYQVLVVHNIVVATDGDERDAEEIAFDLFQERLAKGEIHIREFTVVDAEVLDLQDEEDDNE